MLLVVCFTATFLVVYFSICLVFISILKCMKKNVCLFAYQEIEFLLEYSVGMTIIFTLINHLKTE